LAQPNERQCLPAYAAAFIWRKQITTLKRVKAVLGNYYCSIKLNRGSINTSRGGPQRKCLKMCISAFRRQPRTATSSNRHHFSTRL
jgi:hypothetical protein